ncbi:N-acetylmuramoyl-L-alanine amidase LytC [Clostridiaceae bacterium BL-3]|nr:N-acetylmuramoyl-L-alanine amidase LytC [Clostridiaceae bacterium BL-3]
MKNFKLAFTVFLACMMVLLCGFFNKSGVEAAQNVIRLGGTDRFDTSVKIADYGWKSSRNVVIADGQGNDAFADAVAGTSLAYYLNCPILLTNIVSTPDIVKNEIKKLGAENIYIMGGTGVISASQENSFRSEGYNVTRIAGTDRFDTACRAADILNSKSKISKVYIVPSDKFQYALIAAPYAAREGAAILFTGPGDENMRADVNGKTRSEILKLGVKNAVVVGSYNVVSYDVEAQLENMGLNCLTIHGTTPQSVASGFMDTNKGSGISISSDSFFADALSSSVLTARHNYNPLLVNTKLRYTLDDVSKPVLLFGGTGVVSDNLGNYIKDSAGAHDISNDEIYQLLSDSRASLEDVMYSADNKEQLENVITSDDGTKYVPTPDQYSSYDKVENFLSKYGTDDYVADELDSLGDFYGYTFNGNPVSVLGNVGINFYDFRNVLVTREDVDYTTIQAVYNRYDSSGIYEKMYVTLKFQSNKWKISNLIYK